MKQTAATLTTLLLFTLLPLQLAATATTHTYPIPYGIYQTGNHTLIAETASPEQALCVPTLTMSNDASTHPGNDVLVISDGAVSVLADVEQGPGAVTVGEPVLLGVSFTVVLSVPEKDLATGRGVSSIEGILEFSCLPPVTTTSTTIPSTSTTSSTLPPGSTTTTTIITTTTVTTAPPSTTTTTTPTTSTTMPPTTSTTTSTTTTSVPPITPTVTIDGAFLCNQLDTSGTGFREPFGGTWSGTYPEYQNIHTGESWHGYLVTLQAVNRETGDSYAAEVGPILPNPGWHDNWFGEDIEIDGFTWETSILVSRDGGEDRVVWSDVTFCPLPTVTSTTHVDPPPTVEPPPELPRTGIEAGWVAVFGGLVLLAGIGLVAFSKKEGWQL